MQIRADATEAAEYRANGWWGDETIGHAACAAGPPSDPTPLAFVSGGDPVHLGAVRRRGRRHRPGPAGRRPRRRRAGRGAHARRPRRARRLRRRRAGRAGGGRHRPPGRRPRDRPPAHAHRRPHPASPSPSTAAAPPAQLVADLAGLGAAIDRVVLVDVDGAVVDAGAARRGRRGRRRATLRRPRPRRPVPAQLHLGHHRPAQVRHAHPEPVVLLPPAGRAGRRLRRRRGLLQRHPRPVRLRALDRPLHPGHPRLPHGGDGPLRRRRGARPDRARAGHRAVLREHAVHHDAERQRRAAPRPQLAALDVHRRRGRAVRAGGRLRGRHRRQGAAVLRLQRDRRPQLHDRARRPRAPLRHRRPHHRRHEGAPPRPRDARSTCPRASTGASPRARARRCASATGATTGPTRSCSPTTAGC